MKALPTLFRARKEWVPPDWDKTLELMKAEGRDISSIDHALKDITKQKDEERSKTGKYLMPNDLAWCRKYTRFKEKDLLAYLKKFRQASPKGDMNRAEFETLFKKAFPGAQNPEDFINAVFDQLPESQKDKMDFKVIEVFQQ